MGSPRFKFVNLEGEFKEIKLLTADLLGFGVDEAGFLYDYDEMQPVSVQRKYVNIDMESDKYINIAPFSVMNTNLLDKLFHKFITDLQEDVPDLYVTDYVENATERDHNGIQQSRLCVNFNGIIMMTKYYYVPGLKFISMMMKLSGLSPEECDLTYLDNYNFVKAYNERTTNIMELQMAGKLDRKKIVYDFE